MNFGVCQYILSSRNNFAMNCQYIYETRNLLGVSYHLKQTHASKTNKTNSVAFSPQANYTNWATATCRWNLVPSFADRVVLRGQHGESPTVVNLSFLDWNCYFSMM
jgi:hypothetical protein